MNVGTLKVTLKLDTKEFQSALNAVGAQLKQVAAQGVPKINTKGFSDVNAAATQMKKALGEALPVQDQLTKRLAEQEKQHSILSQSIQQTIAKHGEGSLAAQKQELALQKLTNNIDQTKAALNSVGSSASAMSNDLRKVDKGAIEASNKLNTLTQTSMNTAKALAGIAIVGIAGVGAALGSTIQSAGAFQQELANLGAVSNATAQQMDTFRNVALEMGASTKFTATEAAQGLTFLAMAGFDATEATAALPGVLMAAAAGNMDLAETADIVSNIMGGFQMETSRSSEVADVLAYAAANSNTNISQLGLAFSYIAPVANQAGHSIQSAAAAIGFLSDAGLQGEKAGTVYRQMLLRLQAPTSTAANEMQNLGIQVRNADGTMKSMPDILRAFESGLDGVGLAQRDAALKTIFGAEALGGFNILLGRGADSLQEFTSELDSSGGSAETMAARQMDSLFGAFELFRSAVDAVAIAIGSRFLPALQSIIEVATSVISGALPRINAALDAIFDYFNSLADSATGWGNAIGDNFASGIMRAASSVIDALMQMGSIISYWLTPGSPPPLLPELDQWGKEAAQVYLDSFNDVDFGTLKKLGDTVKDVLSTLVSSGDLDKTNIIPTVIGTREAFTEVQNQLNKTGSVSEEAIKKVVQSTGNASSVVEPLIRSYFAMQGAANQLKTSQDGLARAQENLTNVTQRYDRVLSPLKEQLKGIKDAEDEINREDRIKKLQDQISGTKSEAEQALDPITKQLREIARQQTKLSLEKDIEKYKAELEDTDPEKAQEAALKLSKAQLELQALELEAQIELEREKQLEIDRATNARKAQLELDRIATEEKIKGIEVERDTAIDAAKSQVDAAKQQLENAKVNLQIAEDQYKLEQSKIDAYKEQNALLAEQQKLIEDQAKALAGEDKGMVGGKGGGGGSSLNKAAEEAKKAQDAYNYSIADTSGKLEILRGRLAGVEQGSAEYYQILGQVRSLEDTKAKEQDSITAKALADADAKAKAERNYNFQLADTSGKLGILRGELANVEVGGTDYYSILGQIASLEATAAREAETLAKGVGGVGGSAGIAGGSLGGMGSALSDMPTPVEVLNEALAGTTSVIEDARASIDAMRQKVEDAKTAVYDMGKSFTEMPSALEPFANLIKDNLLPALAGIGLALTVFVLPAVAGAVAAFLTMIAPITAVIAIGAALGIAWNNNFLGIRDITFAVLDAIKNVVTNVIGFVTSFWQENGDSILSNAQTIWNTVYDVISTIVSDIKENVMAIVGAIVSFWQENGDTILAYGKEVWDKVYNIIKTYITLVWEIVKRVFDIVAEIVTTTLSTIQDIVKKVWSAIAGFMEENSSTIELIVDTLWESLKNIIDLALGVIQGIIDTALGIVTGDWDKAKEGISTIVETLITFVTSQFETLKKFVTEIGPEMLTAAKSIGQSIVDGISQGISAGASAIADAAKNAAQKALDAAKGLLGIKSPSSVFEKEIGGNIIQGMALGLQKTDPIERAMSGMMNSIIPANSGAVTNQTTWNVNINTSQSVNSVLSGLELRQSLVGR